MCKSTHFLMFLNQVFYVYSFPSCLTILPQKGLERAYSESQKEG